MVIIDPVHVSTDLTNLLKDGRCVVCQSILKRINMPGMSDWKDNAQSDIPYIFFECALEGGDHYRVFLNDSGSEIEEEKCHLIINKKEYHITQYWENFDVVITVFDEDRKYRASREFPMPVLAFDFLGSPLEKNVNRLKTILTFQ